MSSGTTNAGRGWRTAARGLGNVFLGIAIGLLGYYLLTDLLTRYEQRSLAETIPAVPVAAPSPAEEPQAADWSGWAAEDQRYWEQLGEGEPFGRLVADRMRLDSVVVKGTSRRDLMKGPGWITTTDYPGPSGNCGISGHRTTFGAPFRQLDRLRPGDTIRFYSPYRVYTYRVRRVFSVTPDRVEVIASTKQPQLTLTACHPPYSAKYRLIAQSDLVGVQKIGD